ncbi:MAG: molybdate ABC transporter substrate-binding protein [Marinobacterium sp.]|nr:molybdate ABC transporter substrate-binding protein [Marinobacterium sp.]
MAVTGWSAAELQGMRRSPPGMGFIMKYLLASILLLLSLSSSAAERIHLFAASSLTTALSQLAAEYERSRGVRVLITYAASSALARQISQGAPADLYLSANQRWMDYLQQQALLQAGSQIELLRNRLVLVAHPALLLPSSLPELLSADWPLSDLLGEQRLAMADPAHVPAGIYGREALQTLQLWPSVHSKLTRSHNVRAALALVEQGEAPLGLVYRSDAHASTRVQQLALIPSSAHSLIRYPMAITRQSSSRTQVWAFYEFLQSAEAQAVFRQQGFEIPERVTEQADAW